MFSGVYWNQAVYPFVYPSVYKILHIVIMSVSRTPTVCFNCSKTLQIQCICTYNSIAHPSACSLKGLQNAILKCRILLFEELCPFELGKEC